MKKEEINIIFWRCQYCVSKGGHFKTEVDKYTATPNLSMVQIVNNIFSDFILHVQHFFLISASANKISYIIQLVRWILGYPIRIKTRIKETCDIKRYWYIFVCFSYKCNTHFLYWISIGISNCILIKVLIRKIVIQ